MFSQCVRARREPPGGGSLSYWHKKVTKEVPLNSTSDLTEDTERGAGYRTTGCQHTPENASTTKFDRASPRAARHSKGKQPKGKPRLLYAGAKRVGRTVGRYGWRSRTSELRWD